MADAQPKALEGDLLPPVNSPAKPIPPQTPREDTIIDGEPGITDIETDTGTNPNAGADTQKDLSTRRPPEAPFVSPPLDERFGDRDVASKAADAPRGSVRAPMPPLREDEEPHGLKGVLETWRQTAKDVGERVQTNLTRITRIGRQPNPPETRQQ